MPGRYVKTLHTCVPITSFTFTVAGENEMFLNALNIYTYNTSSYEDY